ncbi:MAG: hypothetical protein WC415_03140, partial [Patescibacteria group bacterium]
MENERRKILFSLAGKIFIFPVLFFLLFFLSGCSNPLANAGLKEVDNKIGEVFDKFQKDQQDKAMNFFNKKEEGAATTTAESLTDEQKKKIDSWLEENGYNRYGDAKNAIYTGGTPLFDEATGQALD